MHNPSLHCTLFENFGTADGCIFPRETVDVNVVMKRDPVLCMFVPGELPNVAHPRMFALAEQCESHYLRMLSLRELLDLAHRYMFTLNGQH